MRAQFVEGLPDEVAVEATRALMNAIGAGIGGSSDPTTRALISSCRQAWGSGEAPVLGDAERLPPAPSAMVNAFMVTQFDFDDAYGKAIIHPGAPALAGLLAVTGRTHATGVEALAAFALGCEAQLALARAISPSHYARGWHTSATCAAVGAATTAGLLMGLNAQQLALALDLAMTQVVGLRLAHGTTMKGYQVGRGAANGIDSAMDLSTGDVREVPAVIAAHPGFTTGVTDELPEVMYRALEDANAPWEILDVGYKPYPVGMVCITAVEAALAARREVDVDDAMSIRLRVNPLVVELAGNSQPKNEMEARVSLPHAVAVAFVENDAGLSQFSQRAINDPIVSDVRRRIELTADPELDRNSIVLEVENVDGLSCWSVDDPIGGSKRPLTDADLEAKVEKLVEAVAPGWSQTVIERVRGLVDATDLDAMVGAITLGRDS